MARAQDARGPAARAGLERRDLIRTVADPPIEVVAELKTIVRERPRPRRLEVEHAGRRRAVVTGG